MKAIFINEHGGPEQVRYGEVDEPKLAPGEALLEVRSAALNHLDIWVRKGGRGGLAMPHVLGSDAAGVVLAVGEGVRNVQPGDEVVLYPGLGCGACESCARGEPSECVSFGIIGLSRPGAFAERVAVPAGNLAPKPAHLSFDEAAGLTLAYLTAWRMLFTRARAGPGETVLIHGVGGGVALAALQLAKLSAIRAIVTSSSDEKLRRARDLGADAAINYRRQDVVETVRQLTGGRGVDVAIDAVGAATWPVDLQVVRKGGRVALCGVTTGAEAPTDLRAVYWNQLTLVGSTLGSPEELRRLLRAVEQARLTPAIDSVWPLEKGVQAVARMEAGEQFGKIVLHVK